MKGLTDEIPAERHDGDGPSIRFTKRLERVDSVSRSTGPSRPEEEIAELFGRLPDPAAREELAKEFLPLAEYFARRFSGQG